MDAGTRVPPFGVTVSVISCCGNSASLRAHSSLAGRMSSISFRGVVECVVNKASLFLLDVHCRKFSKQYSTVSVLHGMYSMLALLWLCFMQHQHHSLYCSLALQVIYLEIHISKIPILYNKIQ